MVIAATRIAVALAAFAQTGPQPPIVHEQEKYYDVSGRSVKDLQESLRRRRPRGRYDGLTEWRVSYVLESDTGKDGKCRVTFAQSKIEVTVTLPHWTSSAEASDSLRRSWERYMRDLRGHERQHVENGVAAAAAVQKALYGLPAAVSCSALEEAASSRTKAILEEADRRDQAYDQRTVHGLTEAPTAP